MNNQARKYLTVLALLAGAWPLTAQTVNSTPAAAPGGSAAPGRLEDEKVVVLSPFEVTSSRDVGYRAADTLGGTRIRTELRDVGSAISVATKEFMRDIGATDAQTLLQYMTSTEVGGPQGNFMLGSNVGDSAAINDNQARLSPQGNTRVRGLDAADNTRDYYLTDIPFDTYNTSRIDIQRGPNSILFGNGSGAGIINGSTDAATLGKDSAVVAARYGSFGSYRGSLNINRDIIANELAIRLAFLDDKRQYQQEPAFNHDRRQYGALRWEPKFLSKGSAHTSLKVSYENGDISANRPRINTINDAISPWFITTPQQLVSPTPINAAGATLLGTMMPMISHAGYDPFVTGIATASLDPTRRDIGARANFNATSNPNAEAWLGAFVKTNEAGAAALGPGIDVSGGGNLFWMAEYDDPASSDLGRFIFPSINNYNAVNSAGVRDGQAITGLRNPDMTGLLRLDQYSFRGIGSFLYTLQGVWRSRTITDPTVFDFYNKLLDGPNKAEGSHFNAFNVTLDQTFWNDRLGFQLAFDKQEYSDFRWANLNNPTITMDIYKYLPIATLNTTSGLFEPMLNPNFGRPYVVSGSRGNFRSTNKRDTARFAPYADLDFKDILKTDNILTKILGRHTINGLYERARFERTSSTWSQYALDATQATSLFGPNQTVNGATRDIATISYLGGSVATAATLSGANLSAITALQQPRSYLTSGNTVVNNAYYFDSNYRTSGTPAVLAPGGAFTPPATGLAPNAVGGAATTQNENPINYVAWGGTPRSINVTSAAFGSEPELTTGATQVKNKVTSKALVDQWALLDHHLVITGGIRKDRIDTYYPGNPLLAPDSPSRTGSRLVSSATQVVEWDAPFSYADSPSQSFTSPWLKTYGGVLHSPDFINKHLPWGLQASIFYNRSENFRPENRKDPINGAALAPPSGTTKDYGFMITALDGRVSLKVNRYETSVKNATLQDNSLINFIGDEVSRGIQFAKSVIYIDDVNNGTNVSGGNPGLTVGVPGTAGNSGYHFRAFTLPNSSGTNLDPGNTHWYAWEPARPASAANPWTIAEWNQEELHARASANAFLDSLKTPAAQQFLSVWQLDPTKWDYHLGNNNINSVRPGGLAVTGDTFSKGTEFELFVRPMPNWNITMNVAKTFATRLNLAGNTAAWLNERWDLYNAAYTGTGGGLLTGDVRWFGGGQGNVSSGNARFGRNGYKFYSEFLSKEGVNVAELRPWRYNLITNYNFTKGMLKGAFVGLSYRWEDKSVVGYGVSENNPEVLITTTGGVQSARAAVGRLDIDKPFYGPTEKHIGLWGGYSRKIWNDTDWRIQLNLDNVGESTRLVPISVNPDGSGAAYRIAQGTTWQLSTSFTF